MYNTQTGPAEHKHQLCRRELCVHFFRGLGCTVGLQFCDGVWQRMSFGCAVLSKLSMWKTFIHHLLTVSGLKSKAKQKQPRIVGMCQRIAGRRQAEIPVNPVGAANQTSTHLMQVSKSSFCKPVFNALARASCLPSSLTGCAAANCRPKLGMATLPVALLERVLTGAPVCFVLPCESSAGQILFSKALRCSRSSWAPR